MSTWAPVDRSEEVWAYTAAEAAAILKVSTATVLRWYRAGRYPALDAGGSAGLRIARSVVRKIASEGF
jgi:excisionase family DNA binding protein